MKKSKKIKMPMYPYRGLLVIPILIIAASTTSSCGKSVDLGNTGANNVGGGSGGGGPSGGPDTVADASCASGKMQHWRFTQPQAQISHSVDMLFVVDTSGSMAPKRRRIAAEIPAFVAQLGSDVDYRIAVMPAHGGASPYSGELFAAHGVPKVLNSQELSPDQIQNKLEKTLDQLPDDVDEAEGEMMMYSLTQGLTAPHLGNSQTAGFFRSGAALVVVFVSDENDVCYPPEDHGYTKFPDYVPSHGGVERIAYNRYCAGITPAATLSRLKALKHDKPVLLGAISYIDAASVPPNIEGNEDAIGHGQIELVQSSLGGVLIEIAGSTFAPGLAQLGKVTSSSLQLQTVFFLGGSSSGRQSLRVTVDGFDVAPQYDAPTDSVQIQASAAGHAGSVVDITACQN